MIARLPALQIDWETLLTVNLPALIFVIIAVPLVLASEAADHIALRSAASTMRLPAEWATATPIR